MSDDKATYFIIHSSLTHHRLSNYVHVLNSYKERLITEWHYAIVIKHIYLQYRTCTFRYMYNLNKRENEEFMFFRYKEFALHVRDLSRLDSLARFSLICQL